jgi:cytochrome c oxidase cbb3-type subunit 3/ubiquinol-cytochrome c reductase cytochrome c subunit
MRYRSLIEGALVLLACVASGTLECGGVVPTPQQRHGEQVYARMCAVCHGPEGRGYAADQAPALANASFQASADDNFLRLAISNGRSGTTMSAWATARGGPLGGGEVDALLAALREWRQGRPATLDEHPLTGDAGRGEELFKRECVRCHGAEGTGGPNIHIGNYDVLATASNGFLRYAIRGGRPGTPMPSFASTLGDQGVEDIVATLRLWQSRGFSMPHPAAPRPPPLPLGPVPLNPRGPDPADFRTYPLTTGADVIKGQLVDHGAKMAVLDARTPSDYINEHIAGAVSVPFYDPDPYLDKLPRNAWLVCYCSCPHAESGTLAQKLSAKGFTKVTVLDEGLGVWKARKYPTKSGLDP